MSLIDDMTPTAAQLACAVADYDVAESHDILGPLSREQLQALAVVLAASVDLNTPIGAAAARCDSAISRIVDAVADRLAINANSIRGRSKRTEVVEARQVVCWIAASQGIPSTTTGRGIGRDHSTVLYSIEKVTRTPRLLHIARRIVEQMDRERAA